MIDWKVVSIILFNPMNDVEHIRIYRDDVKRDQAKIEQEMNKLSDQGYSIENTLINNNIFVIVAKRELKT